jgi:hypothetical protein
VSKSWGLLPYLTNHRDVPQAMGCELIAFSPTLRKLSMIYRGRIWNLLD